MKDAAQLAERFFTGNGTTYDSIARLSTLGFDARWKKKILSMIPEDSDKIIDQACGTGILTLRIAMRFPGCRVIGVELRDEYLTIAGEKARDLRLSNVEFILGRAEDVLFEEGSVDCITSSYLAKYADLDRLVSNAKRMLRKGGVLIMHELTRPTNPAYAALWKLQFKFLQTYGAWKYPEWEIAFRELPALLNETRWGDNLTKALGANHFSDINVVPLIFQTSAIITAKK
ncbi:MAG: class I SAM-dependent methyltransferase [Nitrospirae bacterium]|nr:class I SAM-dependent methyltransferase [Nitrospirota bacterium]